VIAYVNYQIIFYISWQVNPVAQERICRRWFGFHLFTFTVMLCLEGGMADWLAKVGERKIKLVKHIFALCSLFLTF